MPPLMQLNFILTLATSFFKPKKRHVGVGFSLIQEDWDALTKEESQPIALSLVTQPQDGWLTLENEMY